MLDVKALLTKICEAIKPVRTFSYKSNYNSTTANAMRYTGVSFTIPANSYFVISARATYLGAKPLNIAINDSSTNANANMATGAYSDVMCTCSFASYTSNAITFYVWARYATASANAGTIYIDGWYIKQ